jgi:RNA polymerase sigma factor (sigma-70 family)
MAALIVKAQPEKTAEEKLEDIFRDHSKFIYACACKVARNEADADDVVQTICLRLIGRDLPDDLLANPRAYFKTAAQNEAKSIYRQRKRQKTEPIIINNRENDGDKDERECDGVVRTAIKVHRDASPQERLLDAISQLEPEDIELVLLYRQGFTDAEIAQTQGKPRGTIASRMSRIREKLKNLMIGEFV